MPTARYGLAATTSIDGRIYAIGGQDANSILLNTTEMYDPAHPWTTVAPMPTARVGLAAAPGNDGRIYAIGGYDSYTINGSNGSPIFYTTVEKYDPATNTWTTVAPMPTARYGLAAVRGSDGRIYAMGGFTCASSCSYLNTVEAYDPGANTWTTVAPMPTGRYWLAAATGSDGRIYAMGGTGAANNLTTVEAYDPATNTWTTAAPMPTGRYYLAAATGSDGRIYAVGGVTSTSNYNTTVEAYDSTGNAWTSVAPMLTARYWLAAATGSDGRIYAIGGYAGSGILWTVEAYSPSNTPVGTNVVVSPNGLSVTFASVSAAGTTTVTVSSTGPAAPAGFNLGSPPTYYDVSTTATVSGPIVLCFSAPSVIDQAQFDLLRVLHGENGVLVDRTILAPDTPAPDFASTTICTRVSSLSPFTLARKSSDTRPPAARPTQTPPANADGWNNTDVTVNWNWMDNTGGTGIDPANCIRSSMSSGQGTLTLKATCIDLAGNSGSASYMVKIDKTAPVTTAAPTSGTLPRLQSLITAIGTATVENTAGSALGTMSFTCFNTAGLNLTLSATDSPSGVARLSYAASGAQTITANTVSASAAQPTVTITISITPRGLTTLTYSATDRAGNQESTKSESVIVGTGFACANPSPAFSMPNHGTLLLNGTATANGKSFPFNQSISF